MLGLKCIHTNDGYVASKDKKDKYISFFLDVPRSTKVGLCFVVSGQHWLTRSTAAQREKLC